MGTRWHNDLGAVIALDGPWEARFGAAPPRPFSLPAAWDSLGLDPAFEGPAHLHRRVAVPPAWLAAGRVLFEAEACAFHTVVRVNGREAGAHSGQWAPFQIELTPWLQPGDNTLALEIWKPGARYPVREALAGFIPDLAAPFGGPWQTLRLRHLPGAALHDLRLHTRANGDLTVTGALTAWAGPAPATVTLQVHTAAHTLLADAQCPATGDFSLRLRVPGVGRWEPGRGGPAYTATVTVQTAEGPLARHHRRVAFRDLATAGSQLRINDRPVHLRGVLDWGWNPVHRAPQGFDWPAQFAQARALGFNLWKACLYVPEEACFEAADEAGQLLWLEMPMWLPQVTPAFKALARREYAAVFERLHHHPSLVVLSLGCELNAQADAEFLAELHALARQWLPDVWLCDNSGSAEAYGGVETALSDFHDYHFYTDPHFFEPLIHHFTRGYRPAKPWLYGEFCDADTLRDFSQLPLETWWLTAGTTRHPDYAHLRAARERLAAAGVTDGGQALTRLARPQATAVRKFILELTRRHAASGGYTLTAWNDTPLATTGIVDDHGQLKFPPAAWQSFNADRVLVLDRERRRRWVGGDRPSPRDPHVLWQGEHAEFQVLLANGGEALPAAPLTWALTTAAGQVLAEGAGTAPAAPAGVVQPVLAVPLSAPTGPGVLSLQLTARCGAVDNHWPLWAVPRVETGPLLAHPRLWRALTPTALADLHAGGRAVWWAEAAGPGVAVLPFWREAIHVFAPDALWEAVPHAGHADLRFFGLATDVALDVEALAATLGVAVEAVRPLWRRFDARQYRWHAYLAEVEIGAGRLMATTLRFAGGLGAQPAALAHNPLGAWLLARLLAWCTPD